MAHFINLISSSSPNTSTQTPLIKRNSIISLGSSHSSPIGKRRRQGSNCSNSNSPLCAVSSVSPVCTKATQLSRSTSTLSTSTCINQNEEYEKFKINWRKDRLNNTDSEDEESSKVNISTFFQSPIGVTRRTSDTFKITKIPNVNTNTNANANTSDYCRNPFKNKLEAISSIRVLMSKSMFDAYEPELKRRFTDRQMAQCLSESGSLEIPSEVASFRWKFSGSSDLLMERMFVIDSELIWDEFVVTERYEDLLKMYDEGNVLLYFINWKRACQKYTSSINRRFKQSLLENDNTTRATKMIPVSVLENDFFLTAGKMRLQVNFGLASSLAQTTVDLMDFVVEMSRVVALKYYLKYDRTSNQFDGLNLTIARDIKVKSGRDATDCWSKILSQIPRVTPQISQLILSKYPTFKDLMEAYDQGEGENLLADLRFDEARRLGPVISLKIYNHFRK